MGSQQGSAMASPATAPETNVESGDNTTRTESTGGAAVMVCRVPGSNDAIMTNGAAHRASSGAAAPRRIAATEVVKRFTVTYEIKNGKRIRATAESQSDAEAYADMFVVQEPGKATCTICGQVVKLQGTNIVDVQQHIGFSHQHELSEADASKQLYVGKTVRHELPTMESSLQKNVNGSQSTLPRISQRAHVERMAAYWAIFVAWTAASFSTVQHEGYKFLLNVFSGGETDVPTRFAVAGQMKVVADAIRVYVTKHVYQSIGLDPVDGYPKNGLAAVAMDAWTSKTQLPFASFTIHVIDEEWKLNHFTAACSSFDPPHTSVRASEQIKKMLSWSGLQVHHVGAVTADKGSNMKGCFELLNMPHMFCACRGLHNAVMDAFKSYVGKELITDVLALAALFSTSISRRQNLLRATGKLPITVIDVRWNTYYFALKRMVDLWETLQSWPAAEMNYVKEKDVLKYSQLKERVHRVMPAIVAILPALEAIERTSKVLSSSSIVTISRIPSLFVKLIKEGIQSRSSTGPELARRFINLLNRNVEFRYKEILSLNDSDSLNSRPRAERGRLIRLAELLDPTVALPVLVDPEQLFLIRELVDWLGRKEAQVKKQTDLQTPSPFGSYVYALDSDNSATKLTLEFNNYVRRLTQDPFIKTGHYSALSWWQSNEREVGSRLTFWAKTVLAIPASSAESERLVSSAGDVFNYDRARLSGKRGEDQVLVARALRAGLDVRAIYDQYASQYAEPTGGDGAKRPRVGRENDDAGAAIEKEEDSLMTLLISRQVKLETSKNVSVCEEDDNAVTLDILVTGIEDFDATE